MPKVAGIVAEFNPFHNGHAALVAAARQAGAHTVVAVMSGNFVQRGSPAVTDKRVRARAALLCGVDLILELPLPWAVAPAQRFARGAVELLAATGCVDSLAFGSECGDLTALEALAQAVDDPALTAPLRELLAGGMTFARAREQAVARQLGPEKAAVLASPNNTLAVEYLRAARELGWQVRPLTLRRVGAAHDSGDSRDGIASASHLRHHAGDFPLLTAHVPATAAPVYARALADGLYPGDPARLDTAILAHLRRLGPEELARLPDLSEGLENRLYAAIRTAATLPGLEAALKTKRYPMARVRRLILSAFLGLTPEDGRQPVPYVRVLGFTPAGRALLAKMKATCPLPVSQSLARLRALGGPCERLAALEELSTDLFALTLPSPPPCGYEYTASAVFI